MDSDDPELEALIKRYQAKSAKVIAELAGTTGLQYRKTIGAHYIVALDGQHIGYVNWLRIRHNSSGRRVVLWQPTRLLTTEKLGPCLTVKTAADAVRVAHEAFMAAHPALAEAMKRLAR